MRISKFNTILDEKKNVCLVKEKGINYPTSNENLSSPQSIYDVMTNVFKMQKLSEEYMYLLCLNNKNRLIGVFEISHGTHNCSICEPREIFIKALLCGASSIVLCHNHPSGDINPSTSDNNVTKRIEESGKLLGVQLLDHIIVGDSMYYSYRESGVL